VGIGESNFNRKDGFLINTLGEGYLPEAASSIVIGLPKVIITKEKLIDYVRYYGIQFDTNENRIYYGLPAGGARPTDAKYIDLNLKQTNLSFTWKGRYKVSLKSEGAYQSIRFYDKHLAENYITGQTSIEMPENCLDFFSNILDDSSN
jgi:hypothetical protein